jgi:hypothetical protein
MGRVSGYKKEYSGLLFEQMSAGKSVIQFCAGIGISRDTFYGWTRRYKSFEEAYKKGKEAAESYWESVCKRAMLGMPVAEGDGGRFNTGLFCFYMKNRFGWQDGVEKSVVKENEREAVRAQTIDVKNLILINAAGSAEARERIIRDLERIEYEDKPGRGA